jgi:hypothetical protein
MKITVKILDIEVVIDRSNFIDYCNVNKDGGFEIRTNIFNDTVMPTVILAIEQAKELYKLRELK